MNPDVPFRYSYWAVPGKILAGCCPGTIDPGTIQEQLSALLEAGITLVVNLMEVPETELFQTFFDTYESILPNLATARGRKIRIERFPIPDRSIPSDERMTSILACIRAEVEAGGIVYVHCLGGIGRTGTVIGCFFVEQGHPKPLEQLQALTASEGTYFWPTPQTDEQRNFVVKWKTCGGSNPENQ